MTKVEDILTGPGPLGLLATLIPNPKIADLPILRNFNGMKKARDCVEAMDGIILPYIEKHLKTYDPNDMRDFMDVYLSAVKDCKDPKVCPILLSFQVNMSFATSIFSLRTLKKLDNTLKINNLNDSLLQSKFYGETGLITLRNIMMDFFLAGSDTTSTSLLWAMLFMIQFPSIQVSTHPHIPLIYKSSRHYACFINLDLKNLLTRTSNKFDLFSFSNGFRMNLTMFLDVEEGQL